MRIRRVMIYSIAVLMFSGFSAVAQDKVPPAYTDENGTAVNKTDGTEKIGYFLETQFSDYFKKCAGQPMTTKDGVVLTSIPLPLIGSFEPYAWIWIQKDPGYSVGNGFSIVVDGADLSKATLPPFLPNDRLPFDGLQDPSTMVPVGVSDIAYSANCSAILAAAGSVETKINFSVAQMSAMIKADYNNDVNAELGLVAGQFNSPFWTLYSGSDIPSDAHVFAHFILWSWYRNHYSSITVLPDEQFGTLEWFKGYAMYHVSKATRQISDKITVNGSGSYSYFGLASVNASGQLDQAYKKYGFADVKGYTFAISIPKDSQDSSATFKFKRLEQPGVVASWLGANAVASLYSDPGVQSVTPSLQKGKSISHKQQIVGMPEALCVAKLWAPVPSQATSSLGTLTVINKDVKPASDVKLPICVLEVQFTPNDTLFSGSSIKIALLDYTLENVLANQKVDITAQKVTYQTSDLPKLSSLDSSPYPFSIEPRSNGTVLKWKVGVQAFPAPDVLVDFSKKARSLGDISITGCKTITNAKEPIVIGVVPTDDQSQVTISQFIPGPGSYKVDAPDNVNCGLSGTLQYTSQSGAPVPLSLPKNLVISYPNPEGKGFSPGTLLKMAQ